jgi:hypothetical protein
MRWCRHCLSVFTCQPFTKLTNERDRTYCSKFIAPSSVIEVFMKTWPLIAICLGMNCPITFGSKQVLTNLNSNIYRQIKFKSCKSELFQTGQSRDFIHLLPLTTTIILTVQIARCLGLNQCSAVPI